MSRLIDADALIELLRNNMSNDIQDQIVTENNINLIRSMPTAYDIEKVVAELEKEHENADGEYKKSFELYREEFWRGRKGGLRKAIEIVKRGGAT